MDDTSYVIYEEPIPSSSNDFKSTPISNSLQIPSSLVMSSICVAGNQNYPRQPLPLTHLIKENISTLSESDIIEAKSSNGSHYNIFPSSILPNSVITFQDETPILQEGNPCKMEDNSDTLVDNSCYGTGDAGSTYRLLLAPLQYSTFLKNNASEKLMGDAVQSGSFSLPISGDNCSDNLVDVPNKAFNCSVDNNELVNCSNKKSITKPQLVIKLLQDDLNFDMVEIISPHSENSQIFEIIEKDSDVSKLTSNREDLSTPGTVKLLAHNDIKVFQQNSDFGENINSSSGVFYNCPQCGKFLPVESFISHKKECTLSYKSVKCSSIDTSNEKDKCCSVSKPNVYWLCLICNQECSSIVNLKCHYSSHSIEELSLALLRCTFPVNNRIEKSTNTDQSTMTETPTIRNEKTEQISLQNVIDCRKPSSLTDCNKENAINLNLEDVCDSSTDNGNTLSPSSNDFLSDVDKYDIKDSELKNLISKSKKKSIKTGLKSRDPHTCPVCKKILSSRGNLVKHLIQHQAVKPWICKECGNGFNSKRDHDHHYLQRHTTLRPNICSICGKGFTNKRTLLEHMVFHKKEREFKCELCNKCFRTKKCVNRHMQRHETNRNFVCDICFKAFRVNIDLLAHVKLVHNSGRKKKFKMANSKEQYDNQNSDINLELSENYTNDQISLLKKSQNQLKTDKNLSHFAQVTHDQLPVQIISSPDQVSKLKEFPTLIHSSTSSILPDENSEFQPISLTEAREAIIINGEMDGQSLIPVTSSSEDQDFNASYSLALHNNKTAVLNEDASGGTFVMIGLSGIQNTNKANWNVAQQYKIYDDSSTKEPINAQNISEIEFLPSIVENIPRPFLDEYQQVTAKGGTKLLGTGTENVRILRRTNNDKNTHSVILNRKDMEVSLPIHAKSLCETQPDNINDAQSQSHCDTQTQTINDNQLPTLTNSHASTLSNNQDLSDNQTQALGHSQTQALNLDIFSQALHLDFQSSQGTGTDNFT